MNLPNLFAKLDKAMERHVAAALSTDEPREGFAADSRAEVTTPKGGAK